MMDEHSIADSVTPADAATEAALLARLATDTEWRTLHDYLVADGFAPDSAPRAYVAYRAGVLLRSVVAAKYLPVRGEKPTTAPPSPPRETTLALGIEADGTNWVQALILDEGPPVRVLRVTANGEVVASGPDDPPPPGWP